MRWKYFFKGLRVLFSVGITAASEEICVDSINKSKILKKIDFVSFEPNFEKN